MFFKKSQPAAPAQPAAPSAAPAAAPANPFPSMSSTTSPPQASPAAPASVTGTGEKPAQLDPEEAKRRVAAAKRAAASFGEIVSLLMRSPVERQMPLQDLEWMVAPAIMTGQFAVADAQSRETGVVMPVGAVLWAFVSPEVDQRLMQGLEGPPRLQPQEWRGGEIPWIIMSIGDSKIVGGLLQQLTRSVFKDRPAKIRARGADGKVVVGRLEVGPGAPQ